MYSAFACETVTGKNLGPLDVTVTAWSRELNGTDTATVVMSPGALTVANRDRVRLYTTPWRMTLVICWDGVPMFAGPFVTRQWSSTATTFNAVGIRSVFQKRKAHTWATPYASQTLAYSGMSLSSIARSLAVVGMSHLGGTLPIVLPSTEVDSDPTHVRNYAGFELKNISDIWGLLTGVNNGPDIDFPPSWTDASQTFIQWTMRTGTMAQPKLYAASQVVFDAAQPGSSVSELTYAEDGSQLTTAQWAAGAGTDVGILMSQTTSATLTSNGFPLLEEETDYKTVSDQATLDTYTAGDLALHSIPVVQWTLTVNALLPPVMSSFNIGDLARVRVANHIWIPDGDYPMRIMGTSGDSSTKLKLKVQGA